MTSSQGGRPVVSGKQGAKEIKNNQAIQALLQKQKAEQSKKEGIEVANVQGLEAPEGPEEVEEEVQSQANPRK